MDENEETVIRDMRERYNMLTTMYSVLRDRFYRRSVILDILEIAFPILVCGMTFYEFSDGDLLYGFSPRVMFCMFSIFVVILALVKPVLDYRARADGYGKAAVKCGTIKMYLNDQLDLLRLDSPEYGGIGDVKSRVNDMRGDMVPVPDRKFTRLKYVHLRKKAFSSYLSENGSQSWIRSYLVFALDRDVRAEYYKNKDDGEE